jgi:hypothetical protein
LKDLVRRKKKRCDFAKKVEALLERKRRTAAAGLSTAEDPKNCAGELPPFRYCCRGTPGGSD